MLSQAKVTIHGHEWTCSVASTPEELSTGLSGIDSISPNTGMLFVLPEEQMPSITTEYMLFNVDIVFISVIGEDLLATIIIRNVEPGSIVSTSIPCNYFLEVNAGEAADIVSGDAVSIEFVDTSVIGQFVPMVVMVLMVSVIMKMMTKIID